MIKSVGIITFKEESKVEIDALLKNGGSIVMMCEYLDGRKQIDKMDREDGEYTEHRVLQEVIEYTEYDEEREIISETLDFEKVKAILNHAKFDQDELDSEEWLDEYEAYLKKEAQPL